MTSFIGTSVAAENPFVLSRQFRDNLITIVNMLPPKDFLRFAATSKEARSICYQSDGISVPFGLSILIEEKRKRAKFAFTQDFKARKLSWNQMQLIVRLPFRFKVSEISCWTYAIPVDEMMITAIRYFLLKLGVRALSRLFFDSWQVDWKEMVPFAKEYHVSDISVNNSTMSNECLKEILCMNLEEFFYYRSLANDEDIIKSHIRTLSVKASFRKETLEAIVKRWLSKDLEIGEWTIAGSSLTEFDIDSFFRRYPRLDADAYDGPLLAVRPLVIAKEKDERSGFFLLREDNKVLNVYKGDGDLRLVTESNFSGYPSILEELN